MAQSSEPHTFWATAITQKYAPDAEPVNLLTSLSPCFPSRELPWGPNPGPLFSSKPTVIPDNYPQLEIGDNCMVRMPNTSHYMTIAEYTGTFTEAQRRELHPGNFWSAWMHAIVEKEEMTTAASGAKIRSYTVRAQLGNMTLRLGVFPFLDQIWYPRKSMPHPDPTSFVLRWRTINKVFVPIPTIVTWQGRRVIGETQIYYPAYFQTQYLGKWQSMFFVTQGPYRHHLWVSDVWRPGNAENEENLVQAGLPVWGRSFKSSEGYSLRESTTIIVVNWESEGGRNPVPSKTPTLMSTTNTECLETGFFTKVGPYVKAPQTSGARR